MIIKYSTGTVYTTNPYTVFNLIYTCRFEMPYNIWCGGCGNHIGMGECIFATVTVNSAAQI